MHMLFNLIKRPDEEQRYTNHMLCVYHVYKQFFVYIKRQMILNGCAAFTQVVEASRVEAELLPQLWEQVLHIVSK